MSRIPGHGFEFDCPGCSSPLEITTGADNYGDGLFSYEQFVCAACRRLQSVAIKENAPHEPNCERCGAHLERWQGEVWFEQKGPEPGNSEERIEGPCPTCGTTLDSRKFFQYEVIFTLWD